MFAIITNKTITKVRTKTIKSPEPTAIEFSEVLFRLTTDLFGSGKRLLCVIDNLDRLGVEDAVEMWATIRSLFSYNGSSLQEPREPDRPSHPIVLVPMDRGALLASFGSPAPRPENDHDDDRASSFIDKTFDITFRVPPPVTSDWRSFLDDRLSFVFPDQGLTSADKFLIRRLFAEKFTARSSSPTPRAINRFANALGALWLERENEPFDFAILAAFVANAEEINKNVQGFAEGTKHGFLEDVNKNWRYQIAALHFGVPLDKGRQLLLTQPLIIAIERKDGERFLELLSYPGAGELFEELTRDELGSTDDASARDFVTNAAQLLSVFSRDDWWVGQSWRNLTKRFISLKGTLPSEGMAERLRPFLLHGPSELQASLAIRASEWISTRTSEAASEEEIDELQNAYSALGEALGDNVTVPGVSLSGEANELLFVVYQISDRPLFTQNIRVNVPLENFLTAAASSLRGDGSFQAPGVLEFILNAGTDVFKATTSPDYSPLANEATAIVSESVGDHTEASLSSLVLLSKLYPEVVQTIDALIEAGHLQTRLEEALSAENHGVASHAITLFVLREKPFVIGDKTAWQKVFESESDIIHIVDELERITDYLVRKIWKIYYDSPHSREFVLMLMRAVVDLDRLDDNRIAEISEFTDYYLNPLPISYRNKLAGLIAKDERLIPNIGVRGFTDTVVQIFRYLARVNIPDASAQIESKLELVSVDDWKLVLQGKKNEIVDAVALSRSNFRFGVQSALLEAMCSMLPLRRRLGRADNTRWIDLYNLLTLPAKRKLLEAVLSVGTKVGGQALPTLGLFGNEIAAKNAFSYADVNAADLVRVLFPTSEGRAWLQAHATAIRSGLDRLSRQERLALKGELKRLSSDRRGDRADWSERMLRAWKM